MGAHKDYWIGECERADEAFLVSLDEDSFIGRLKELGFDDKDAQARLVELKTDAGLNDG